VFEASLTEEQIVLQVTFTSNSAVAYTWSDAHLSTASRVFSTVGGRQPSHAMATDKRDVAKDLTYDAGTSGQIMGLI